MSNTRSSKRPAPGVVEPPKSEMLRRFERHEITLGQYLDHCAEEVVAHLKGLVNQECLQFITTDPVMIRYIEQTTGQSPEVE